MKNAQILVVEDEIIIAMEIEETLKSFGYAVSAIVSSGEEAIQIVEETRPDLVLMDIKLEGDMDGITTAEQIRVNFDIPVIYLTAYADEDVLQRAKITEPYSYLVKPFEDRELRAAIEIALHKHKAERALKVSYRFLEIANRYAEMKPLLKEFVAEIQKFTGCAAVGIRILDEDGNISYQAYDGFSQEFYESESPISMSSDQCICINVIKGKTDAKLPFYTKNGSFYMNSANHFWSTISAKEKEQICNACNQFEYASVALVPIRLENRILGLVHVADARENMVPLEIVNILEYVGMQLGIALQRIWSGKLLWERMEYLRSVVNSAPIVLLAIDSKGIIRLLEGEKLDALGLNHAENIGRSFFDVFRNIPQVGEDVFRALAGKETTSIVELDKWTLETRFSPLRNKNGEITGAICVIIDITERKRTEKELIRLSGAINASTDSIILSNIKGRIIDVNRAALDMYGSEDKGDLIGKITLDIISEEDREKARADMVEVLKKGYIKNREYHIITKDSARIPVEVSTTLLVDDMEGKPIGFARITKNVTERKRGVESSIQ